MFSILLPALLAAGFADPPAKQELFAKKDFYKEAEGKEETFVGVLRHKPLPDGVATIGRYNAFSLEITLKGGKKEVREVYSGGEDKLFKPYADKTIKIVGKPVRMEIVGRIHNEIWGARLEVVKPDAAEPPADGGKKLKVLATTPTWNLFAAGKKGVFAEVVTDGGELAVGMGKGLGKDKEAVEAAARALKVEGVDFKKQAIVVISAGTKRSGGFSVEVTDVTTSGGKTVVKWRVNPPKGFATMALTNPGVVVLIEKPAGKIEFDPPAK